MEKKASKNILLAIMGVLILVELVFGILHITEENFIVFGIVKLIPLVFVTLYGFWLYKKPHGNMLKYAMLFTAVAEILITITCIKEWGDPNYTETLRIFASAILIFVAGRLNRIKQNKYLLPVAFILLMARNIFAVNLFTSVREPGYMFTWFSGAVSILTLMIAYFVRFKEHKEAGLMDAPKEK